MKRRERGQASLELVAMLPFLLLVGALVMQCGLYVWTAGSAAEAARTAARAQSLRDAPSPAAAVRGSLPGRLGANASVAVAGDRVTVTVRVPQLVPVGLPPVRRSAELPRTDQP